MNALINIAHPDFRPWIKEEAERLGIVPRLVVPGFTPPAPVEPIKLGTLTDLSGPQASIGLAALRGLSTYIDHINHWGGVHERPIELVVEDHNFDDQTALAAAKKLVEEDQVFAIVSPLGTAPNLAIMDYLLEKGIPVISPASGVSTWAEPLKPTYFAMQPSYSFEGRILAQFAAKNLKKQRVAIVSVEDQYGQEGAAAVETELKKAGLEPVAHIKHKIGENHAKEWIAELAASNPDLVVLYTYTKPAADLLSAAHSVQFHPTWLGSYVLSGTEILQLAGAEASSGFRTAEYPSGPRTHRGDRLYHNLMNRAYPGDTLTPHHKIGYAAAQLVVEGLKNADAPLTHHSFMQALEKLDCWTGGLLPPISYNSSNHSGLTALAVQRAVNGRWTLEKGLLELEA